MKFALIFLISLVAACGPSDERRSLDNASSNMAARIWTVPQVARSINIRATTVSNYRPGNNLLFRQVPNSLGNATYGEFDSFDWVFFNGNQANYSQVIAGMSQYCSRIQRGLVQVAQGVVAPLKGDTAIAPLNWVRGSCR